MLSSPRNGIIRYVGSTGTNPKARLQGHISDTRRRNCPVNIWVRQILKQNNKPILTALEIRIGDAKERQKREMLWIAYFRWALPDGLKNISNGYERIVPEESRKRAGLKLKNRYFSPEHRRRISEAKTGMKYNVSEVSRIAWREASAKRRGIKMELSDFERNRRRESLVKINETGHWREKVSGTARRMVDRAVRQKIKNVWANMTSEKRKQRCEKIRNGIARTRTKSARS